MKVILLHAQLFLSLFLSFKTASNAAVFLLLGFIEMIWFYEGVRSLSLRFHSACVFSSLNVAHRLNLFDQISVTLALVGSIPRCSWCDMKWPGADSLGT